MTKKRALLMIGLLALSGIAWGSDQAPSLEYRIVPKVFTSDDGLPQSGVSTVLQTRDGYLWLGSFGGLARFDGHAFTIFRAAQSAGHSGSPTHEHTGPASDRVLALHEDADGRLWIGTEDAGLTVYADGEFRQLPVCGGTCQVNDVTQAADGSLWVASNAGLLKLDPGTGLETWVQGREEEGFTRLSSDARGTMYVAGYDGLYAVVNDALRRIPLPGGDARVWVLERDGEALLVGTGHGLFEYGATSRTPAARRWWSTTTCTAPRAPACGSRSRSSPRWAAPSARG